MNKQLILVRISFLALALAAAGCGGNRGNGGDGASLANPAILTVYNTNVDFGDVAVGNTSTLAITVSNMGGSPLSVQQNSLSGAGFVANGIGSGVTLSPGQYATLAVSFNPTATGKASGVVSLSSSTSTAPISVPLSGNGVVTSHWATFDWAASKSAVVGYNIYLRSPSDQSWTRLNSSPVTTTSYTDWDVQSGQSYLFAVTSVSPGNTESAYSNATQATIPSP
jgi:hypothetical protein